jgi:6-phosphogluconolactonase (cycloisomerase 2 family)
MQLIAASAQDLTAGSSPSQALELQFNTKRPNLYLDTLMGSSPGITDYLIHTPSGYIVEQNFAGPPVAGALVLGMSANPLASTGIDRYIYVGLPSLSEVGVYEYAGNGKIYFQRAVPNPGLAVCWTAVNAAGTYLYTAESNSGTVTVYSLTHAGSPVQVQHYALATTTGVTTPAPANLAFDPTGGFLYVLDNLNSVLHVLTVNSSTGQVSEPNPPIVLGSPAGEEALGLATATIN